MSSKRDQVFHIRVSASFVEKMDAAIEAVNTGRRGSDPFAQDMDRSKFVRSLVENFISQQEATSE